VSTTDFANDGTGNVRRGHWVSALLIVSTLVACSTTPEPSALDAPPTQSQEGLTPDERSDVASSFGVAEPPEVALVRVVTQADYPQTQIDCLAAAGFSVKLTPDGQ